MVAYLCLLCFFFLTHIYPSRFIAAMSARGPIGKVTRSDATREGSVNSHYHHRLYSLKRVRLEKIKQSRSITRHWLDIGETMFG
ncbi:hypothetical protein K438DRAFT_92930 [Mycena galopus ATCC 62051]|nr:hypothetical protein K438DRAFT_92930 [Mycena galopus ATCC 62051]